MKSKKIMSFPIVGTQIQFHVPQIGGYKKRRIKNRDKKVKIKKIENVNMKK